ncbi:MAG: NUDIX domain-containing protein [Alphaproteobacteria bacterium]|nr:NUDIX domain-containing protein [Alphaproteobacteria bacterium]
MTLGVRGLARDGDGRVLLVKHTYRLGWHLPGGGVEIGETAEEAMRREMMEEGGIEPLGPLKIISVHCNRPQNKRDHVLLYAIEGWRACAPLENGEIAERGFFALDALPDDTTPLTRVRIAEALGNSAF